MFLEKGYSVILPSSHDSALLGGPGSLVGTEQDGHLHTERPSPVRKKQSLFGEIETLGFGDILDGFCEANAKRFGLVNVVVIHDRDGVPRSMGWKSRESSFGRLLDAEESAWRAFITRFRPDTLQEWVSRETAAAPVGIVAVMELPSPLLGILQCETSTLLTGEKRVELEEMGFRLAFALEQSQFTRHTSMNRLRAGLAPA
jgi:hypothetical protein